MEIRKGFETALDAIEKQFEFLNNFGFIKSGHKKLPDRVSVGFKGSKYDILLNFEFIEENFDFSIIEKDNPNISKPIWKVIQDLDPNFNYNLSKPNLSEYKTALNYLSHKLKAVLPEVLSDSYYLK